MAAAVKIVLIVAVSLLGAGAARAQQSQPVSTPAAAPERCEGTLCDLYYANRGNAPSAPAAAATTTPGVPAGATALTAPSGNTISKFFSGGSLFGGGSSGTRPAPPASEPAEASNSYMHMGTNGVLGDGSQRCSGTMCDLYYGSSPAEPQRTPGQQAASAGDAGAVAIDPPVPHRHIVHESETRPKCSSPTADPWHCYR